MKSHFPLYFLGNLSVCSMSHVQLLNLDANSRSGCGDTQLVDSVSVDPAYINVDSRGKTTTKGSFGSTINVCHNLTISSKLTNCILELCLVIIAFITQK